MKFEYYNIKFLGFGCEFRKEEKENFRRGKYRQIRKTFLII